MLNLLILLLKTKRLAEVEVLCLSATALSTRKLQTMFGAFFIYDKS